MIWCYYYRPFGAALGLYLATEDEDWSNNGTFYCICFAVVIVFFYKTGGYFEGGTDLGTTLELITLLDTPLFVIKALTAIY